MDGEYHDAEAREAREEAEARQLGMMRTKIFELILFAAKEAERKGALSKRKREAEERPAGHRDIGEMFAEASKHKKIQVHKPVAPSASKDGMLCFCLAVGLSREQRAWMISCARLSPSLPCAPRRGGAASRSIRTRLQPVPCASPHPYRPRRLRRRPRPRRPRLHRSSLRLRQ